MIKVEEGHVILKGSKALLKSEISVLVKAFLSEDAFDEEDIDEAVRLGKMDDDEIHEEFIKSLMDMFMSCTEENEGDDKKC